MPYKTNSITISFSKDFIEKQDSEIKINSLKRIELTNWDCDIFEAMRSDINHREFKNPGIYILVGTDQVNNNLSNIAYIGQAGDIKKRLQKHINDYYSAKPSEDYYWEKAYIFTKPSFEESERKYIEQKLIEQAKRCDNYIVKNIREKSGISIHKSKVSPCNDFIENVITVMRGLGLGMFEYPWLFLDNKSRILAQGRYLNQSKNDNFIVLAGAKFEEREDTVSIKEVNKELCDTKFKKGEIKYGKCLKDVLYTSPSASAKFIKRSSISGPEKWFNRDGISLNNKYKRSFSL